MLSWSQGGLFRTINSILIGSKDLFLKEDTDEILKCQDLGIGVLVPWAINLIYVTVEGYSFFYTMAKV